MQIIILAGGGGTRLWPLSRKKFPKQFLSLIGDKSLIQNTALRVKKNNIWVVTNQDTEALTAEQLSTEIPFFQKGNVIVEPLARNTAPAIAYGASFFEDDEVLVVLPADHHIQKTDEFNRLLAEAEVLAKKGNIVTFGIIPHRPETGYGYIKVAQEKIGAACKVEAFKEKPDKATAEAYLKAGNYYWNSGMFVFTAGTLRKELAKYCPDIMGVLRNVGGKKAEADSYAKFPSISIDYAVMEKTDKIVLLPADIGWSDIGGFEALWENLQKDANDNAIQGRMDLKTIDSKGNLFFSGASRKKIVAGIGIKDLVIVDTDDVLLVSDKKESQRVKEVFTEIQKEEREEAELHTRVFRPWGYYRNVKEEPGYKIKEIVVYPGERLSLQSHDKRSESWTVVQGQGLVINGESEVTLKRGDNILIPMGAKHRLSNPTEELLTIVEVQMGEYLGEDDIVRYQDDYNR